MAETATKRASSTRPDGEIRAPRPLSMACFFSPRHGAAREPEIKLENYVSSEKSPAPLTPSTTTGETATVDDGRNGRRGTTQAVKSSAVNLATFCETTPPPACVRLVSSTACCGEGVRRGSPDRGLCARRGDGQQRQEGNQKDAANGP